MLALATDLVRRRLLIVTVRGDSMRPTFEPGDRLLVSRSAPVRAGSVVVLRLAEERARRVRQDLIVKRAAAVAGDPVPAGIPVPDRVVPPGRLVVLGDNPGESYDSRVFGYLPADAVIGVLRRRLRSAGCGPEQGHQIVEPHHQQGQHRGARNGHGQHRPVDGHRSGEPGR